MFVSDLVAVSGFVRQPGDANEDRQFDTNDIIQVLGAGKYETGDPATWAEGDWDRAPDNTLFDAAPLGDGLFNTQDIILALSANLFEMGPYAAVGATQVPEPSTWILSAISVACLIQLMRPRR